MTPLQLSILIHYRGAARDYREGDFSAPAVREAINEFVEHSKLLEYTGGGAGVNATYKLSARGEAFVDGLCALPLPEQVWVMPKLGGG